MRRLLRAGAVPLPRQTGRATAACPSYRGLTMHQLTTQASASTPATVCVDASCGGVAGSISLDGVGNLSWTPFTARQTPVLSGLCCLPEDSGDDAQRIIASAQLLGASTQRDGSLQAWYCDAVRSKAPGGRPKVQYKLRKTPRFQCSTQASAEDLAHAIRQRCAWWGRSKPQRLLVVCNPQSGQRRADKIVNSTLLPMLRDAGGLHVNVHQTKAPGDAEQLLSTLDLESVDMVVYVGGDGTVFEGLQGLLSRPDWAAARHLPFAHVPGGSGNGLAASCGLWDPVTAAYSIAKGRTHPLDVTSVLQPPNRRYYSFLSCVFGMWGNMDIGTEANRWLGDSRYTLRAVQEAFAARAYPIRVSYWPHDQLSPQAVPPLQPLQAAQPSPAAASTTVTTGMPASAAAAGPVPLPSPVEHGVGGGLLDALRVGHLGASEAPPLCEMEGRRSSGGGGGASSGAAGSGAMLGSSSAGGRGCETSTSVAAAPPPISGGAAPSGGGKPGDELRTALLQGGHRSSSSCSSSSTNSSGDRGDGHDDTAGGGAAGSSRHAGIAGACVDEWRPAAGAQDQQSWADQQVPDFPSGPPLPILSSAWPSGLGHPHASPPGPTLSTPSTPVAPRSSSAAAAATAQGAAAPLLTGGLTGHHTSGQGQMPSTLAASNAGLNLDLNSDPPQGWRQLPTPDLQVLAVYNVPYMATHAYFNPQGRLASGTLDLQYMYGLEGLAGRATYLSWFLQCEDGGHVAFERLKREQVRAVLLQPLCSDTFLALDGESIPITPLLMEVHAGLCSVCVAPQFEEDGAGTGQGEGQ